jgi:hypothetical protein
MSAVAPSCLRRVNCYEAHAFALPIFVFEDTWGRYDFVTWAQLFCEEFDGKRDKRVLERGKTGGTL